MRVLVVGNGGREHALAWKLLQSPRVQEVFCVPGNGGTAQLDRCRNIAMGVSDFEGIARLALVNNTGLIVVGPEVPLAEGITDYLQQQNLTVFGPTQAGAQIESSKAWAKALMREAKISTAASEVFTDAASAIAYIKSQDAESQDAESQSVRTQGTPIVIKADGLAAGKGVTVAMTVEEAIAAVEESFGGQFGAAGQQVLIEEYLIGQEVSILAITDGLTIRPLLPAQDHKQVGEGDTGANTGGMGAYAPTPVVSLSLMERIQTEILEPAIAALRRRGIDYRGVLYAGLMITPEGEPKVIEFNCRFGDPETQVVLPLLETPLDEVLLACVEQRLEQLPPLAWKAESAACVVIAAGGYPETYKKGYPIQGIEQAEASGVASGTIVFHAGTKLKQDQLVSDGGRVLAVTALGETFETAIAHAYEAVECIEFRDLYYRKDIGHRILKSRAR
ncbi:MAG: phosphoribosylamine--glycine ligase [Drouetiella hepatica Uher 2000/2452]|uniref:Phosphoribosylamine--glycine ligase n=1 Tax=Drouetiella hepatica Uher 2000/2452 TaxID=904376 RepID=A0A951QF62_9CYAN|nr:phosphoribosylamine--glycine ligase [Drouetiella hepatica Uher 2000/2452]